MALFKRMQVTPSRGQPRTEAPLAVTEVRSLASLAVPRTEVRSRAFLAVPLWV
jgi:hypothetical protein